MQLEIKENKGFVYSIRAELQKNGYDTSNADINVWTEVMKKIQQQNEQNKAENKAEIYRGGSDIKGSGHSNFVVDAGTVELSTTIWEEICNLFTKKDGAPATVVKASTNPTVVTDPNVVTDVTTVVNDETDVVRHDTEDDPNTYQITEEGITFNVTENHDTQGRLISKIAKSVDETIESKEYFDPNIEVPAGEEPQPIKAEIISYNPNGSSIYTLIDEGPNFAARYENGLPSLVIQKDKEGNEICRIETTFNDDGTPNGEKTYINGQLSYENTVLPDGTPLNEIYYKNGQEAYKITREATFDETSGNTTMLETHTRNGEEAQLSAIKSDQYGNIIFTGIRNGDFRLYTENNHEYTNDTPPKLKASTSQTFKSGKLYSKATFKEGVNFENRYNHGVADSEVFYEDDGITVRMRIERTFDTDGALASVTKYDKDGNVIYKQDNFEYDEEFNGSYQTGKGDCYLLTAIDSLVQTPEGKQILKDNVTFDKANKTYTIQLPGAQKIIADLKAKFPDKADLITINTSYTVKAEDVRQAQIDFTFALGDANVIVYELAYRQFREDVQNTVNALGIEDETQTSEDNGIGFGIIDCEDVIDGGVSADAIFILTGKHTTTFDNGNKFSPEKYGMYRNLDGTFEMRNNVFYGNAYTQMEEEKEEPRIPILQNIGTRSREESLYNAIMSNLIRDSQDDGIVNEGCATMSMLIADGLDSKYSAHVVNIRRVTADTVFIEDPADSEQTIPIPITQFQKVAIDLSYTKMK